MRTRWPFLLLILAAPRLVFAQDGSCPALVNASLLAASEYCSAVGRNQACYGHGSIEATGRTPDFDFNEQGDLANLIDLETLKTGAFDVDADTWGVGILKVQANLPDALPGQAVTVVVFGDAELESADVADVPPGDEPLDAPMQAFVFRPGIGRSECAEAPPNGLLMQTPRQTTVTFGINGVRVTVGSTLLVTVAESDPAALRFSNLSGSITLVTAAETVTLEPGQAAEATAAAILAPPASATFDATLTALLDAVPSPAADPVITGFSPAQEIVCDDHVENYPISFVNPDGDAIIAIDQPLISAGDDGWYSGPRNLEPGEPIDSHGGSISYLFWCNTPEGDSFEYDVTYEIALIDAAGNRSSAVQFTIHIRSAAP